MIGETSEQANNAGSKEKVALRDALVSFLITLFSALLAFGFPPTYEVLYMTFVTAGLTAIISYAHAYGIKKPSS